MKKLLAVFLLGAFTACGNANESTDAATDTTSEATEGMMNSDTMGAGSMSGDTSNMSSDTGAMSTPH